MLNTGLGLSIPFVFVSLNDATIIETRVAMVAMVVVVVVSRPCLFEKKREEKSGEREGEAKN